MALQWSHFKNNNKEEMYSLQIINLLTFVNSDSVFYLKRVLEGNQSLGIVLLLFSVFVIPKQLLKC